MTEATAVMGNRNGVTNVSCPNAHSNDTPFGAEKVRS